MSARMLSHEPLSFGRMPPVIRGLIIANAAVFLLSWVVGPAFYDLFGLVPRRVIQERWLWQLVTYLFLHGNFMHLLFNLFALWMFGMHVESQWGGKEFLKYYLLCGLGAAAASLLLSPGSTTPIIGASGPVYGLLVAFAMLYPDAVVYLYFFIPVKASHMAILFGLIEFFAGATAATPGIARFAHLGGMVTGYLYIRWWWVAQIHAKGLWGRWRGHETPPARRRAAQPAREDHEADMAEIDRILDKILVSGIDSLTDDERALMRRYSERLKH